MSLKFQFLQFLKEDRGAITVDWTVLSAASVALALATAAVMTDITGMVGGQVDQELRNRQLSDDWVQFIGLHFEDIFATGFLTAEQAEFLHDLAYGMDNDAIVQHLADGIAALENGELTTDEVVELVAVASIAEQRNLADDAMLDYYFGFGGSDPYYMTTAAAPNSAGDGYGGVTCDGEGGCVYGGNNG